MNLLGTHTETVFVLVLVRIVSGVQFPGPGPGRRYLENRSFDVPVTRSRISGTGERVITGSKTLEVPSPG